MMRTTKKTTRTTTIKSSRLFAWRRGPDRRERSGRARQRGIALILVLWTFAAVAVLAAEFARAMRDEAASTRNFKESTAARMVAIAAMNEVILAMQADRREADTELDTAEEEENPHPIRSLSHGDGQWVPAHWHGHPFEVRVTDEAGKINLNKVTYEQLIAVFDNLEIDDDEAEIIADSIIDWRDDDDLHRTNGAESEYYEGLDRPYMAKNAAFDTVEELLLVRGVSQDVFYGNEEFPGLGELFSVFNTKTTLNGRSVKPEVMMAIGGLDAEAANDYAKAKYEPGNQAAAVQDIKTALAPSGFRIVDSIPQQLTIETKVKDLSGTVVLAHIGAVLKMDQNGEGLRLYRWYDSIFDDSDESGASAAPESAS